MSRLTGASVLNDRPTPPNDLERDIAAGIRRNRRTVRFSGVLRNRAKPPAHGNFSSTSLEKLGGSETGWRMAQADANRSPVLIP